MRDIEESTALRQIVDRHEIQDVLSNYARGVDRGDWDLVRSTYHVDAHDDHIGYRGDVDGLIAWLDQRFADVDNSAHFLGNCLIEFAGPDVALVETYFVSSRVRVPDGAADPKASPRDGLCRQAWGRYLDRFERREGVWSIARRRVVIDARFDSVAIDGLRGGGRTWGTRDERDPLHAERAALRVDGRR